MNDIQLVSSLNISMNLEEYLQDYSITGDEKKYQDQLIKAGIITNEVLPDEVFDDDYLDYLYNKFHFSDSIDDDLALSVIRYQTSIGGDCGHAFFVSQENEIIIYPHGADCGLGFIMAGNAERQIQQLKLLREIESKYKKLMSFKLWG